MKIAIWCGCIVVYSVVVTACRLGGVTFGALPTALLFLLLVILPAPVLCRAWDRRGKKAVKASWPAPGNKLCGTPFVRAGEGVPAGQDAAPAEKRPRCTRLEIGLAVACAVLVVTSSVLGYKVYEFRSMAIDFIQVNADMLEENTALREEIGAMRDAQNASASLTGIDDFTAGYLEERENRGLPYYVASVNSDIYHCPSCDYVENILEQNRTYYLSEADAVADGKHPCSVCNP